MNHSNDSTTSRATLKLKPGTRKPPKESKTLPVATPQNPGKQKPGAHWSDEYKERMQADMDALVRR